MSFRREEDRDHLLRNPSDTAQTRSTNPNWCAWILGGMVLVGAVVGVIFALNHQGLNTNRRPPVILVSFDGFRWDYYFSRPRGNLTNFDRVLERGVGVQGMLSPFVTNTFPSHWTLVTGAWEETHGIVNNNMYDPVFDSYFNMGTNDTKWWNASEPIWITAVKQGHVAGCVSWPGSNVELQGLRATYWNEYNGSVPYRQRIDQALHWLSLPTPPSFISLYFEEPDTSGHRWGPSDPRMEPVLQMVDQTLGYLLDRLEEMSVEANLIVTADHGMADVSNDRIVYLSDYIDLDLVELVTQSTMASIRPNHDNLTEAVYRNLSGAHPNMTVFLKQDLPDRWHYRNNRRVTAITASASEGWAFRARRPGQSIGGSHGYDNALPNMHPILLARGPAFHNNATTLAMDSVWSVDLYALMCELMGIRPAANNGTKAHYDRLLRRPTTT